MSYGAYLDNLTALQKQVHRHSNQCYKAIREAQKNNLPFTELEFRFGKLYTLSRTGNWRVRKQQS